MGEQIVERDTPKSAQIDTIRKYQLLPGKKYTLKLLIILLLDILIAFSYYNVSREHNAIYNTTILDTPLIDYFVFIGIYTLFFAGGYIAYLILSNISKILKGTFDGVQGLLNILNPFYSGGKDYKRKETKIFMKGYNKEQNKKKKKQGKSEILLYLSETFLGKSFLGYLSLIRVILYLSFFTGVTNFRFTDNNIYTYQFIVSLIIYLLLAKEPNRTRIIAKEHLKDAFYYYCSPYGKSLLSKKEKEIFDENFKVRIDNQNTHYRGYWSKGVYNNQEFHYSSKVSVEDLKDGFIYSLDYPTDSTHQKWTGVSGIEMLTKRGIREVRGSGRKSVK